MEENKEEQVKNTEEKAAIGPNSMEWDTNPPNNPTSIIPSKSPLFMKFMPKKKHTNEPSESMTDIRRVNFQS